ncbi:MAG: hypothetical protein ABR596_04255 [Halarsenatibacteraceae bacterium]
MLLIFILIMVPILSITTLANSDVIETNISSLERNLNDSEIEALGDADPEEVKDKVNTIRDVLNYLNLHVNPEGGNVRFDPEPDSNIHRWEFTEPGESVIKDKTANCAGAANLAFYLLEDSYDEVGYFHQHSGYVNTDSPGGHSITYVKDGDEYILFDPQQAMQHMGGFIFISDNLEELAEFYVKNSIRHGTDIAILIAIENREFLSLKSHSDGVEGDEHYENRRLRYHYDYEDYARVIWEDPDDPMFLEFGSGPGRSPREYREYYDEDHYLAPSELSVGMLGGILAGVVAIFFMTQ